MRTKLRAGAATSEIIFPKEIFPIEGFEGIHDAPHARVLILEEKEKAVLVSLEVVMLPDTMIEVLKNLIQKISGIEGDHIWIHVTHSITTMHAPHAQMVGVGGQVLKEVKQNERKGILFEHAVTNAVKKAAESAHSHMQNAKIGYGVGSCDINGNRDQQTPFGWWVGEKSDGISNKQLSVMKLENEKKEAIAYCISYDIKPCAIDNSMMKERKRQVSSDVPGRACMELEETFGVPVLFFMSAAGDQIPREQTIYDRVDEEGSVRTIDQGIDKGFQIVEKLGHEMATDAKGIMEQIACHDHQQRMHIDDTSFQWDTKDRVEMYPRLEWKYQSNGKSAEIEIGALVMDEFALVFVKPEINSITGLQMREQSAWKHTWLISMVNGGMKYMPDQMSYDRVTWEAMNSMLMPGAAEQMVHQTEALLKRLKETTEERKGE